MKGLMEQNGKGLCRLLQNGEGKTIASVYSVRPVPAACFYASLWEEIETGEIMPAMFTIESVRQRLEEKDDIFSPVLEEKYSLNLL